MPRMKMPACTSDIHRFIRTACAVMSTGNITGTKHTEDERQTQFGVLMTNVTKIVYAVVKAKCRAMPCTERQVKEDLGHLKNTI
jgi:hypothetical protein